jgi:hypothetical protein
VSAAGGRIEAPGKGLLDDRRRKETIMVIRILTALFLLPVLALSASWQRLSVSGTTPGNIAWTTACYVNSWKKIFVFGNGAGTTESQGSCYLSKYTGGLGYLNTEHTFDHATRTWTMIRDDHDVTNYQSMIESRRMNDAMTWPDNWPGEPPGRDNHQIVYDPILDVVYLLGGTCSGGFWMYRIADRKWFVLSTKGLYTDLPLLPESDTYFKSVNAIGEVFNCAMAFDYLNRRVVIQGGRLGSNCPGFDRTYTFDCTNPQLTERWVRIAQNSAEYPPAMERGENNAVYDPVGEKMIWFGGGMGWCGETKITSTWELDCKTDTWHEVTTSPSPPARYYPCFVYDPYHRRAFLHGGDCGGTATWAYDPANQTWSQIASGPTNRRFSVGGYDLENRRFIIYTGDGGNETWALTYEDGQEYPLIPYPSVIEKKQPVNKKISEPFTLGPNPFHAALTVTYPFLLKGERARISVYGIKGQKIKDLSTARWRGNRTNHTLWDGTDQSGKKINAGAYLVVLNAPGVKSVRRAVFLK